MVYSEIIIPTLTATFSSILIVDTLIRPKQIYQNWLRQKGINKILRQFKHSLGHWIIVTGTQRSGKSAILNEQGYEHLKVTRIGKQPVDIWQFKNEDLYAIEIGFADMGGISDCWWQILKQLKAKRIYYFLTIDECKRFKAKHHSQIDTHIVLSQADKIQGFSPFMSDIVDKDMAFPIGKTQEVSFTKTSLQEAIESLYAQLQTYGNQLLSRISNPEAKKVINDFPQHWLNLHFGLTKIISAMPVKQIYCYGQTWQNGSPKIAFTPPLASGISIVTQKRFTWRKSLLILTVASITAQIFLFKLHLTNLWAKQPMTELMLAKANIEQIENKQPFFKFLNNAIGPEFKLTPQQFDEASELSHQYTQNLEKMSPLIAALDIRQFNHKTKKDKHINELLKNNLTSEEKNLQHLWNQASNKEQFIASLHHTLKSKQMSDPLPNNLTDQQIKNACLALTNRLSASECNQQAKTWLTPHFEQAKNFKDLISQLEKQTFDNTVNPLIVELITWLKTLDGHQKKSFLAFEFLIDHTQHPEKKHILNKLNAQSAYHPELKDITITTWQLVINEACLYIDHIWQKTIYPYHVKQFSNHYPLVKNSPNDSTLSAFNQYYGTGGLINIFYNSYVQPLVDKHHQTFNVIYPGTHIPLKTSNLEYFKAVAAVQTLLYQGDSTLHLEINFSPVYKNETWTFSSNQLTMEMNKEMIVGWPMGISQDGVTIKEGKKVVSEFKGPWGFWRWFESGQYANNQLAFTNHTFTVNGQTDSDLNWISILRSQKPEKTLL